MSTPSSVPATPTPGHGSEGHLDSDVFSSPARGVGWSPSTASAPLGLLDNGSTPNFNFVIDANISPIHRSSLPKFQRRDETRSLTVSSYNQPAFGHEEDQVAEGCAPLCPSKQPSTPHAESLLQEGGTHSARSSVIFPSHTAHMPGGQSKQQMRVKLDETLSPVSLSYPSGSLFESQVEDLPTKSHPGIFFPPPASPPPFAPYPAATAHTSKTINSAPINFQNINARSNSSLPSNSRARHLAFPSAVPLADDPFLVSSCLEEGSAFSEKTSAGIPNGADYLSTSLVDTSPLNFLAPPTSPLGILPRERAARMRMGLSDSRTELTKPSNHKSKYRPRSRKQPVSHATSTNLLLSIPLSPDPLLAPTYEPFFSSFEHEADSSRLSTEPNPDMVLSSALAVSDAHDDSFVQEGAGWSTPIISPSYTNPSTTLRCMLPTPSLTSASFASPLSMNNLATPTGNHLFPSPDIVSSPLLSELHSTRGRDKRLRAMTIYATPTRFDPESLEAHDLVEGSGTNFSESQSMSKLVGGVPEQLESSEGGDGCNQNMPAGERSHPFCKVVYDTSFDQEHQTLDPREGCYQLDIIPRKEDVPTGLPFIADIDVKNTLVPTIDPASIYTGETDAPPILGKRLRGASASGGRPGAKLSKGNGGYRISTAAETGNGDAQSEPTHRAIYFERPTRSQSRAAAALLALAASSPKPTTQTGAKIETLTIKRGNSVTRPTTRGTTMVSSVHTPATKKVSRQPASQAKRGVIGRAPSRVLALATSSPPGSSRSAPDSDTNLPIGPGLKADIPVPVETSKIVNKAKIEELDDEASLARPAPKTHSIPSELLPRPDPAVVYGPDAHIIRRTFPEGFPINLRYSKWYRRFPVSAFFMKDDPAKEFALGEGVMIATPPCTGSGPMIPNPAPYFNIYVPRFVRGIGADKVGLCAICIEPVWRGGEGRAALFNTKISAYRISPRTGLPFSPPIAFQRRRRQPSQIKKLERETIEEGQCHVPELYWWKHAASCHGTSHYAEDRDPYIEDSVYLRVQEYIRQLELEGEDKSAGELDVGHLSANIGEENLAAEELPV